MNQPAKVQEPSMEEILASIRRIIADDDAAKAPVAAAKPPEPPRPAPAPAPQPAPAPAAANKQDDIDAILNGFDAAPAKPEPEPLPELELPAPPPPAAPASEEPAADILDLTEAMAASAEASSFRPIEAESDVVFEEEQAEPLAPERRPSLTRQEQNLMSRATSDVVNSAFNSLAQTVLVQNARTLEDLVREMLRPMLKSWLDDNLPGLVERLVRAEIDRVSRGR